MAEYQGFDIPDELLDKVAGGATWAPEIEQSMKSLMMTFKSKGMTRGQAIRVWINGGENDAHAMALIDRPSDSKAFGSVKRRLRTITDPNALQPVNAREGRRT